MRHTKFVSLFANAVEIRIANVNRTTLIAPRTLIQVQPAAKTLSISTDFATSENEESLVPPSKISRMVFYTNADTQRWG
jgi:hypothetical protein